MQITEFCVQRDDINKENCSKGNYDYCHAVVNNHKNPTDCGVIASLAELLFEMYIEKIIEIPKDN